MKPVTSFSRVYKGRTETRRHHAVVVSQHIMVLNYWLCYAVAWPFTILRTVLAIGLVRIASSLPIIQDKIKKFNEKHFLVPYEDFWQSWCSWSMVQIVVNQELTELKKTAKLGLPAPNCKLVSTDGHSLKRLLDFEREDRPLVLNFGSCS